MKHNFVWQQHISKSIKKWKKLNIYVKFTVNKLYFVSLIYGFVAHLAVSCDGQTYLSHIINTEHTEKV